MKEDLPEATGFQKERDTSILQEIYGDKANLRDRLRDDYLVWFETGEAPEEERTREGYATTEECKENVVDAIEVEIRRLKIVQKRTAAIESQRTKVELLRRSVPDVPGLDRLLPV